MKKLSVFLTMLFVAAATMVSAQEFETPKTGAKIFLSSSALEVASDTETTFDLWVVRSKKAKKSKFDQPKFLGSKDLEFVLTQNPSDPDNYKVTVNTKDVKPGTYFYTVSSRSRSTQKVTGTTISVQVGSQKVVASDNN